MAARLAVGAIAVAAFALSLQYGVKTAGGADSFGYLSQAYLWHDGTLAVRPPGVHLGSFEYPGMLLVPLANTPGAAAGTLAPVYPPGLPLLMAAPLALFGTWGPFLVVPISAALLIAATFVLGRRVEDMRTGLVAAVLVAFSPAVIYQSLWPMSDVPAAAVWTLCLAVALGRSRGAPLAAGALAGLAILIRPNLALLALFGAALLWRNRTGVRARTAGMALYALAAMPSLALLAWFNGHLHGSPLTFGYESLDRLYSWSSIGPNLVNYSSWFVESQGVLLAALVLYGWGRAVVTRPLLPLAGFAAAVVVSYLPYLVFDDWWYLRFLLPAYPVLFVMAASAGLALLRGMKSDLRRAAVAAALVVVLGVFGHAVWFTSRHNPFELHRPAHRFAQIASHVRHALPRNAAFITMQHSGSVRYYAARLTVRHDWLPAGQWPFVRAALEYAGYDVYVLVDEDEEVALRRRFTSRDEVAFLDRPPLIELWSSPRVRVYRLSDDGEDVPQPPHYLRSERGVPVPPASRQPNSWEPPGR